MAMSTTLAMLTAPFAKVMPVNAEAMRSIYYSAGDVDNMVSASTFIFGVPEGCSFEYCDSSRFSRKGYKLVSWTVLETGQTVGIQQPSFMPEYDLHVIANWEPVTYSICLAGNGGTTAANENNIYVNGTYGTTIDLPENPFSREGYTFAGWEYDGRIYEDAAQFEVPAVISGGRIVLAAVWKRGTEAVTTAPNQPAETISTTVATQATTLADDQTAKVIDPNVSFRSANEAFKVYISDIIGKYDAVDSIEFRFETDAEKVGNVSTGFATALTNGQTYQQNFGEYVNDNNFTIKIDKNVCEQLSYGRYFQFVCWHSDSYPLKLAEVKAIVREIPPEVTGEEDYTEPDISEPEVTTVPEEEENTATTVTSIAEVIVSEEEPAEEVTEPVSNSGGITITLTPVEDVSGETTATETEPSQDLPSGGGAAPQTEETTAAQAAIPETTSTEPVQMNDTGLSRVIYVGRRIARDTVADFKAEELLNSNEKLIRIDVALRSDGESIGQYSCGTFMNTCEGSMLNNCFADRTDDSFLTITAMADSDHITIDDTTLFNVGYWWGDLESITIESITVYYTASEASSETEPASETIIGSETEPVNEPEANTELQPEPETEPMIEPIKDYDGDGTVTTKDLEVLRQFLVGANVDGVDHENNDYDINGDGYINVYDSIALKRIFMKNDNE